MASETLTPHESINAGALIAQMRPALVRFFRRRCRNISEAEDLAQEVLTRSLCRLHSENPEKVKGYIFRSAINLWRDRERRLKMQNHTEVLWDAEVAEHVSEEIAPERVLLGKEQVSLVQAALLELNERTRDVFMLRRLEQLKFDVIAQMLGISVSAVEKHMHKALAHLTLRLNDHESH